MCVCVCVCVCVCLCGWVGIWLRPRSFFWGVHFFLLWIVLRTAGYAERWKYFSMVET